MNVSTVGTTQITGAPPPPASQPAPEAAEPGKTGADRDGGVDDARGANSVPPPPAPTVNLNGEKVGQVINLTV